MHDAAMTFEGTTPAAVREDGQAAVEFALVLPILCLILFASIEFGMAFWTYQQVSSAASEGARRAAVSRTSTTRTSDITTAVQNASPNLNTAQLAVDVNSSWTPGESVTVTVRYPENLTVMGRTFYTMDLVSRRTARVEH